ncbi:hypothetical protein E2562_023898 [Oryza meyeriana var. granulata]|uniref:Uncharacterized protein n=1 Tax=Oryza meyeriana var. granulata TaxID=110450 RepID=A0A6G1D790_9ORYZ|nr:hypothetical protein E2562_023898 [Oryza meyeriana var. granulata]
MARYLRLGSHEPTAKFEVPAPVPLPFRPTFSRHDGVRSAKSQGGHIQEPVHGRGHYEAHEEEEESSSAADAAIPAANEGAANAPSPPVETLAKRLLREQPGGGGRGAEVSASASPVGDREGKKTSGAIEGGANASSPPPAASLPFKHLAKGWLPHEQPGGGGRGAEGSASASPVGDREGKKTSAATESGPHASSPPPAASPGERLAKRLPHDHRGGGGRGSEGSTSPSPVVDRKGKKICVDTQGGASASSPPPPPPALVPTFESLFERLLREQPGDGGRGTEGSTSASAAVVDQ